MPFPSWPTFMEEGVGTSTGIFYRDDDNIRVHVKMILALTLVPNVDVTNALEMLVESDIM